MNDHNFRIQKNAVFAYVRHKSGTWPENPWVYCEMLQPLDRDSDSSDYEVDGHLISIPVKIGGKSMLKQSTLGNT